MLSRPYFPTLTKAFWFAGCMRGVSCAFEALKHPMARRDVPTEATVRYEVFRERLFRIALVAMV